MHFYRNLRSYFVSWKEYIFQFLANLKMRCIHHHKIQGYSVGPIATQLSTNVHSKHSIAPVRYNLHFVCSSRCHTITMVCYNGTLLHIVLTFVILISLIALSLFRYLFIMMCLFLGEINIFQPAGWLRGLVRSDVMSAYLWCFPAIKVNFIETILPDVSQLTVKSFLAGNIEEYT